MRAGDYIDFASRNRGRLAAVLLLAAILAGLAWWFHDRSVTLYSSDARVGANMVGISAQVRGTVAQVPVEIGQRVGAGAVLMRLDDTEERFHLAELEAKLAALESEETAALARRDRALALKQSRLAQRHAELRAARAALKSARAAMRQARRHYNRVRALKDQGVESVEAWDVAETQLIGATETYEQAEAAIVAVQARIREAEAEGLDVLVIERELDVLKRRQDEARHQIDRRRTVVERHVLKAPTDGVIDELFLDVGEQALPGFRAVLMHDPADIHVEANIKETEIRRVRIGASVRVSVDAYPGRALTGRVVRIRDVATSEFALIPNPNASGVFTKITQRVPIRVALEESDLPRLRPGTMVVVAIDTAE